MRQIQLQLKQMESREDIGISTKQNEEGDASKKQLRSDCRLRM